ncbi:toll/interleukin-1 receptor domain-containing protein [Actinoplanes derwentensis]|uniref:TIR domain-containing protein n=1 Tax=Actinoplanes derwentensis TaxID=113562 RepID=A0A1H2C5N8_9ACTN|nr:toll/interleukin-1 receptor domain-containing protein [Actinoplanes derwentensis]GID84198.1 hypothetical protein Ade03nite_31220 [Actinoplanes derwentensis]SDT65567.1 TIR domain-containing protein [Actinoplanes derwentensis]
MPVLVSHATADEPWAQWIAGALRAAGYETRLDPADSAFAARLSGTHLDGGHVLLLLSAEHRATHADWTLLAQTPALVGRLFTVRLDAAGTPRPLHAIPGRSLHGLDEEDALETLLTLTGGIPRKNIGEPGLRPTAGW